MKISSDKIQDQLAHKLQTLYLIAGEEPLLVQETADAIRHAARTQGFSDRRVYSWDKRFDWGQFSQECRSLSLFGDKKLLELRLTAPRLPADDQETLIEFFDSYLVDTVLLIFVDKLEPSAAWVKRLDRLGVIVTVWPVNTERLPQWLKQRAHKQGLQLTQPAISALADRVEGNLLAAEQELLKLRLIHGAGPVDEEAVLAAIGDSARFNVYTLVDYCVAGLAAKAVRVLWGLQAEGLEPPILLWALAREIRSLLSMQERLAAGYTLEKVFLEFRVWDRRKPLLQIALKRHSSYSLFKMLGECEKIDRRIKGFDSASCWDGLLQLVLALAGLNLFES